METIEKTNMLEKQTEQEDKLRVGDMVVIKEPIEGMEVEDYYYLDTYAKKKGTIYDIRGDRRKNYFVEFESGKTGIFYKRDLVKNT